MCTVFVNIVPKLMIFLYIFQDEILKPRAKKRKKGNNAVDDDSD